MQCTIKGHLPPLPSLVTRLRPYSRVSAGNALTYWVTRQDVAQEEEKWAEWAALATAADSAHFSVSCATSCRVALYTQYGL